MFATHFQNNPRTSVIMDYFIPNGKKEGIQLDVFNSENKLIATCSKRYNDALLSCRRSRGHEFKSNIPLC